MIEEHAAALGHGSEREYLAGLGSVRRSFQSRTVSKSRSAYSSSMRAKNSVVLSLGSATCKHRACWTQARAQKTAVQCAQAHTQVAKAGGRACVNAAAAVATSRLRTDTNCFLRF